MTSFSYFTQIQGLVDTTISSRNSLTVKAMRLFAGSGATISTADMLIGEAETDHTIEWINENAELLAPYAGEWVVIDNFTVRGHSLDFSEASEIVRKLGLPNAVLYPVIDHTVSL